MLPEELRYPTIAKNLPLLSHEEKMDILTSLLAEFSQVASPQEKVRIINFLMNSSPSGSAFFYPVSNGKNVNVMLIDDIYYIRNPKGNIIEVETVDGFIKFETCRTNLLESIEESNEDMKRMDYKLLVNKSNIRAYDSSLNRVHFSEDIHVGVTGVALKNIVMKVLDKSHDLNNAKFEYAPIRKARLNNN